MNRLDKSERAKIVACLVEGNSLRATARITGFARMTIEKLLRDLGAACAEYQDRTLRNLTCQGLQLDEIWSFVGKKDKNKRIADEGKFGVGSVWTWTAIDADTKLIPSWLVSSRDAGAAYEFVGDLASRISGRVQVTADAYKVYVNAVPDAFGTDVDFAILNKIYGKNSGDERTYSPATCIGTRAETICGNPNPKHVSTSHVERQNLTMRMHMRRFTRLTNAFSKKVEMHAHAVALHFMYYNFAKIHQTLRVTPAMEAGVSTHVWSVEEIVSLLN